MNLADEGTLRKVLQRHGLTPDKSLGQHFLVDEAVVDRIVVEATSAKGIFEIGPGPGVLTSKLVRPGRVVVAIELDKRMSEVLSETAPSAQVYQDNVLQADLRRYLEQLPLPRAVVSNIPYYITGPILERIASIRDAMDRAIFMMQKEVADRIVAAERSSARGALSVAMQTQFRIKHITDVPRTSFLPPPRVDSTVLAFEPLPRSEDGSEPAFLKFVHACFIHPRKTLANNMMRGLALERQVALGLVESAGFGVLVRPQELSNVNWKHLFERFSSTAQ